jgi:calcineurin-like phosphoesterase family protein
VAPADHVKILAVADEVSPALYERFDEERWKDIDLILSCGDVPPDYLDFLCSMLNVPVLYVRGNHDATFPASAYDGCENVHGRVVEHKGLRVAGFEGCMWYNGGRFQYKEGQMRGIVRRARFRAWRSGLPDIILTHAPPRGCHDGADACHRGFEAFRGAIEAWRPSFLLHGHMHAYERGERDSTIGDTRVVHVFPYTVLNVPLRARQPSLQPRTERSESWKVARLRETGVH